MINTFFKVSKNKNSFFREFIPDSKYLSFFESTIIFDVFFCSLKKIYSKYLHLTYSKKHINFGAKADILLSPNNQLHELNAFLGYSISKKILITKSNLEKKIYSSFREEDNIMANVSRYHELYNNGNLTFVHQNLYEYGLLLLEIIRNSMNLEVITII